MNTLSLSDLCHLIGGILRERMPESYWVRAEVASLQLRNSHAYFELVEKADTGIVAAKARATCWASVYPLLSAYFLDETGEHLQVGMQILIEVELSFHDVYGLSLNIINIDPSYTVGDLARRKQETIRRLQQEGIWDMQRELMLPTLVRRIAIISSAEAAGYEDFVHQLGETPYPIQTRLFPAIVQGERAEQSIIAALGKVYEEADAFDAVVIIRGGGATTDLSCFDGYELSSHCAQFPLPILTGIGHTRDVSIVDMVVHLPLKTPTAVAAFLIGRFRDAPILKKMFAVWGKRAYRRAQAVVVPSEKARSFPQLVSAADRLTVIPSRISTGVVTPKAVVGEVSSASMRTVSPAIANTSLTPSDASTISWDRTPPAIATSPASAPILPPIPTTVSLSRIPRVRTRASSLVDRTLHDKMQLPTA